MDNLNYNKNIKDKTVFAFEYLQKRNIKNNLIFVLTDDTEVKNSRSLKLLSFSNEIIYLNIFDYFENNLLVSNSRITLKNSNTKFLNISLDDEDKIKKFKELRKEKIKIL